MPSFVPVMRMLALGSSGRGMAILVAVFSSSSCSFSPFLPITKRWCSLGMATMAEAWKEKGRECLKLITMETQRGEMAAQSVNEARHTNSPGGILSTYLHVVSCRYC